MKYIKLLKSTFNLDADLEKDLLLKTNNNKELVNNILNCLPENKRNRNFAYWLLKLNPQNWEDAKIIINEFFDLINKRKINPDINKFNSIEEIKNQINQIKEKEDDNFFTNLSNNNIVLNYKNYIVIELNNFNEAHKLCNTSKNSFSSPWCIAIDKEHFYKYNPPYYLVFKNYKPYAVITENEIWDLKNNISYDIAKELKNVVMNLRNNGYYVASEIIDYNGTILEEDEFENILENI